jgi:hypothetical protein
MTTPETARCLGLIAACNARIEGMKAANAKWALSKVSPLYEEADFFNEAAELERIAMEVINQ